MEKETGGGIRIVRVYKVPVEKVNAYWAARQSESCLPSEASQLGPTPTATLPPWHPATLPRLSKRSKFLAISQNTVEPKPKAGDDKLHSVFLLQAAVLGAPHHIQEFVRKTLGSTQSLSSTSIGELQRHRIPVNAPPVVLRVHNNNNN